MSSARLELQIPACARRFVRALWGIDVRTKALPGSPNASSQQRPRFLGSRIWLPASLPPAAPGNFANYLLAAAAHASAHLRFGVARSRVGGLKPVQVAIVSLLEDARVERLASEQYPGLARLWAPFHEACATRERSCVALLTRLARSLHSGASDEDSWVTTAHRLFFAHADDWRDPAFARELGARLGNDLGQMRLPFEARAYVPEPPYRDDHLGLWQLELESAPDAGLEFEAAESRISQVQGAPSRSNPVGAGEPQAREQRGGAAPLNAGATLAALRYPEWDYVIARERPGFCTLQDKPAVPGDEQHLASALARYASVQRRLERAALRLAHEHAVHQRALAVGNRLDLRAAITALVPHVGVARCAPRVYRRTRFQREPPALLVLIDSSESLNALVPGTASSTLELARTASALLASTLNALSRDWAMHAFCSNGRHDVSNFRFKDFDEPYDADARARLAGMRAGLSTRLGTALRHAGRALRARSARRKLLLVVSDGDPSDVDVHDPEYLACDARRATEENRRLGVVSFCVGLDSKAERPVRFIFGPRNFLLIDHLEQLPERLARLSLRLTG
jgi:hypothetical protein